MIDALGSLIGIAVGWVDRGVDWILNFGKDAKKLSARTKRVMEEFFSDIDIDTVRMVEHARLAAPSKARAMTHGHKIYWEGGFQDCQFKDQRDLMHELVHVRQYERLGSTGFYAEYGRFIATGGNWLEIEADGFVLDHGGALEQHLVVECPNAEAPRPVPEAGPPDFWIVWGPVE